MTDYTGAISLSKENITATGEDISEHSQRSIPTSPGECGGFHKSPNNMIIALDNHPHQSPSSSENTARKPRGRPPGSKNKPRPPVVITKESSVSSMKPVILEIAAGSDIIDAIISYARRNQVGISINSVIGSVSNVTLRHPVSQVTSAISFNGPFVLLSLSGSFVESTTLSCSNEKSESSPSISSSSYYFGVKLAGLQGQVFGGIVGGNLVAATQVIVAAATFVNPEFHRLPCACNVGGVGGGGDGSSNESGSSAGKSMGVYGVATSNQLNSQVTPDVMPWGSSSRPY